MISEGGGGGFDLIKLLYLLTLCIRKDSPEQTV